MPKIKAMCATLGIILIWLILVSSIALATPSPQNELVPLTALEPNTAPNLISPEHEAVLVVNNPSFTWSSVDAATAYDIQISTSETFSSIYRSGSPTDTSWIVSPQITDGTYYWRVRAKGESSDGPWSATRRFNALILSPPNLISPLHNATLSTVTVTLTWSNVSNATAYDIQVSTSETFNSIYRSGISTSSSWIVSPPLPTETYYWRVRAKAGPHYGNWSLIRSFSTNVMAAPNLISPANGATITDAVPILVWEKLEGATSYNIYVSSTPNFSKLDYEGNTTNTEWGISEATLPNGIWYWIVRGKKDQSWGLWSEVRHFNLNLIDVPILQSPPHDQVFNHQNIQLTWSSINEATSYDVQISFNYNFSSIHRTANLTDTTWHVDPILGDGIFYWRVRAHKGDVIHPWSLIRVFRINTLTAPILISPANGATIRDGLPTLSWQAVENAYSYYVIVSSNPNFSTVEYSGNPLIPELAIRAQLTNGTWYWLVRACCTGGSYGPWSEVRNFKLDLLDPPTLNSPSDRQILNTTTPELSWNGVDEATAYDVQVGGSLYFTYIHRSASSTNTNWTVTPALENSTFYWRVRAKNSEAVSPWSFPRQFTIQIDTVQTLALFNTNTGRANLLTTLQNRPAISRYISFTSKAPIQGQWVMGDWDGNGTDTPAVFAEGAAYLINDLSTTQNWSGHWIGPNGTFVAGRFNPALNHDCLGVIEQTFLDPFTVFVLYYACDFTTNAPIVTWHWMSAALYDETALPDLTGDWQFAIGDWSKDGAETPAIRRGPYVAYSNVPIVDANFTGSPPFSPNNTGAEFAFAQYIGVPYGAGYGQFVTGDWNGDGRASFGLFYSSPNLFCYYNNLNWLPGTANLQYITNYIGNPRNIVSWQPIPPSSLTLEAEQALQSLDVISLDFEPLQPFELESFDLQPLD